MCEKWKQEIRNKPHSEWIEPVMLQILYFITGNEFFDAYFILFQTLYFSRVCEFMTDTIVHGRYRVANMWKFLNIHIPQK